MKFPRNARIFRGQLDAAPFVSVFFVLVIFILLASLLYTPGVRVQLPVAENLPGIAGPTVSVAMDLHGRYYFENQVVSEGQLKSRLATAATNAVQPLTLIIRADKNVPYEKLVGLAVLARSAGIRQALLATAPRAFAP